MSNNTAVTQTTNIVPVQGVFAPEPTFAIQYFVGPAGTPFYAPINPNIDGVSITNSTINSTTIGATSPSTGNFTNISTTTGTISTTPVNSTDIANKNYVDSVAQGLDVKASCVYSTTNNITLSGLAVQAGGDWASSLTAGDRVLVKNQSSSQFNGIYVASASTWARSSDMNVWAEVPSAFTFIESGATLADTGWVSTANQGGTIDVTAMPWSQFSGAGTYLAGDGLQLIGNTFSVKANGTTLDISSSGVKISDTYVGQASITTLGTIATGTWNGNTIGVAYGGTGLTSYTIGDLIYASGATTLSKLPDVATGNALISGGVGVAPLWGKIGLTTHVSGTLPIANGGTNATATATAGAVAYGTGTAYAFSLAGTAGQVLISGGTGSPTWANYGAGDVTGPASATDNAIARYDGTTGKLIQNSGITIDDNNNTAGVRSVGFSGSTPASTPAGTMWFDTGTGSYNAIMGNGNITQQIGEEIFVYGKASAAITDSPLKIVYHTGTVGASGVITFAPTIAGITDANAIVGIATEDLANNAFGRVTVFGVVRGITTNGTAFGETWADDDVIWYNPVTGNPTKVEPVAPYIKVQVGLVIKAGSGGSGSFQVSIIRGSKLGGTDSNVQFGTLANNDLIQYSTSLGYWTNVAASGVSVGTATNLAGGAAASIPYQSASGTTAFLASASGDANKVLQSNGTSAPSWVTPVAYATVTDDTTTNAVRYPLFANQTTGSLTTTLVSSTKYNFNPSSGLLTATGFSGSGASLTSLPAGQLSGTIPSGVLGNSSLYIGTTAIALNRSSSAQSLTGVNIDGSAGSATTAGTATNANNVAITDDTTTAADMYLSWVTSTTGNLPIKVSSTKLKFNPSTGVLTATGGVLGGTF
jgi:hypothetical protein